MIEFFGSESRVKLNLFKWSNKITIITYTYYIIIYRSLLFITTKTKF